jgi:drug/metabolite transporter (DMT)-like permease
MIVGIVIGLTGYAMVATPIDGLLEVSAILFYGTALWMSLLMAWRYIRRHDVVRHREWILRAIAIVLGIATTRPVVAAFFATSPHCSRPTAKPCGSTASPVRPRLVSSSQTAAWHHSEGASL